MRLADGTRYELAASGAPSAFALDASHVYWISRTASKVERALLAGGTTELVAAIDEPWGSPAPTLALTSDAVIYADHPTHCDPTIMGCMPSTIESMPK
jgi:hypothetical protein